MRRPSCRSYKPSNCAQKDKLWFNKPSDCARKGTLRFNKLLILLNSGRRPPLYFLESFVREEQRLIINHPADPIKPGHSLPLPPRDGCCVLHDSAAPRAPAPGRGPGVRASSPQAAKLAAPPGSGRASGPRRGPPDRSLGGLRHSMHHTSWEGCRVSGGMGSFINAGGGETETLKGRGFGGRNNRGTPRSDFLAGLHGSDTKGGEK